MKLSLQTRIAALCLAAALAAFCTVRNDPSLFEMGAVFCLSIGLFVFGVIAIVRALMICVMAVSLCAGEPGPVPAYTQPLEFSLNVSMPIIPGQERNPILVGAVCVLVGAAVAGYIGVQIYKKCVKIRDQIATNNAQEEFQAQSVTSPDPIPNLANPTAPASGICIPCSDAGQEADDAPLPILVEASPDGTNWTAAAVGLTRDQFYIPATGFWRASVMPLTIWIDDGIPMIYAPPGVLEFSPDLSHWTILGTSPGCTDLVAQAGFYRVRL